MKRRQVTTGKVHRLPGRPPTISFAAIGCRRKPESSRLPQTSSTNWPAPPLLDSDLWVIEVPSCQRIGCPWNPSADALQPCRLFCFPSKPAPQKTKIALRRFVYRSVALAVSRLVAGRSGRLHFAFKSNAKTLFLRLLVLSSRT